MTLKRILASYEKFGDSLVDEMELDINLDSLRKIWKPYDNDPSFYMSYPVSRFEASVLESKFGIEVDLNNYDYFLECYAVY